MGEKNVAFPIKKNTHKNGLLLCECLARHGEKHAYGIYNIPIGYLT
jgi:hypothetical protein